MRSKRILVFFAFILTTAGCSRTSQPPANDSTTASSPVAVVSPALSAQPGATVAPADAAIVKPKVDACGLLTSDEVQAVQGEAIKETKLSGQATGGFNMSQCFFTLPTFTNSISLLVAHRGDGAGAHDPKEFWRETFHESEREEKRETIASARRENEKRKKKARHRRR